MLIFRILSSSEAEYRILTIVTCEIQWLLYLLHDLHISCSKPPMLYCDSQSAMHIAANPVFHECIKHLEIVCHIVRDKVQVGVLKLLPVPSQDQLANFLMKSLLPKPFSGLASKLNMVTIYPFSSWVGVLEDNTLTNTQPVTTSHQ